MIHIRFLHHVEELPRVGRQRFHVASLPLGIDRIEGQRRLAGTRKPRNNNQLVTGNIHIDVLEIMLSRAAHLDVFQLGHSTPLFQCS